MPNKAVFLDRDNTLIEDPGYLADPDAVRTLPGVELALKSLSQAGYLLVVVTNQSGIARGLLTEDALERIHERMVDLLAKKGAHIDEIYYCPYHSEGTVREYAVDSDLRKPEPGMLLQAAEDLDLNIEESWMVGDSARDIEAGQRAGCRTVRIRTHHDDTVTDRRLEECQADFTVRNLVEAARVILRERKTSAAPRPVSVGAATAATGPRDEPDDVPADADADAADVADVVEAPPIRTTAAEDELPAPTDLAAEPPDEGHWASPDIVRREILREVRQLSRSQSAEEFSLWRLAGTIVQMLALLTLLLTFVNLLGQSLTEAQVWGTVTVALQVMALTLTMMQKRR